MDKKLIITLEQLVNQLELIFDYIPDSEKSGIKNTLKSLKQNEKKEFFKTFIHYIFISSASI